jgi:hypothetical protein
VNVTPFYTNCGDYVNDNFVGQHRYDTPIAVGPSPWNPQSPVPAPTAMASHRNLNQPFTDFVDGGFEALGQAWNEIATSAPPAIADPFIEFWVNLIRGPAGVISSTWDTTGSVEVVHAGGGFALELLQTADTSLAQQIYLGQSSHEIAFDLSVISTGTDDYLEVLVGTERVGSIRLSGLSSQVRRYGVLLPEGAARFAPVSFRLVGPATTPARVYLDNLAVRSVGVAVGQVALSATSWAEGVSPLAAIARPIMVGGGPSAPSPWANLNQVSLDFSGDAAVRQSDLTIRGPNQGLIPVTSFSYDSVRNTGTWTLGQPLLQGRHTIELSSALIDGDRNGQPGGTFRFSFDVLPGDVDGNGRVDRSDLTAVHRSMFEQLGTAGYDPELDIDGNGRLSVLDTIWVRNRIGSTIVGQSPQPDAIAVAAFPESRSPTAALRIADRTARHPRQDQRSTSASIGYADRQRLDQPRPIAARALRSAFRKLERIDTALANWPS